MRVPLHCPDVPLALSRDLSMTLVGRIQVDYVEETAAARNTDTKEFVPGRTDLKTPSSYGAHSLVPRTKEEKHLTRQMNIPLLRTLHLTTLQKGLHEKRQDTLKLDRICN